MFQNSYFNSSPKTKRSPCTSAPKRLQLRRSTVSHTPPPQVSTFPFPYSTNQPCCRIKSNQMQPIFFNNKSHGRLFKCNRARAVRSRQQFLNHWPFEFSNSLLHTTLCQSHLSGISGFFVFGASHFWNFWLLLLLGLYSAIISSVAVRLHP